MTFNYSLAKIGDMHSTTNECAQQQQQIQAIFTPHSTLKHELLLSQRLFGIEF